MLCIKCNWHQLRSTTWYVFYICIYEGNLIDKMTISQSGFQQSTGSPPLTIIIETGIKMESCAGYKWVIIWLIQFYDIFLWQSYANTAFVKLTPKKEMVSWFVILIIRKIEIVFATEKIRSFFPFLLIVFCCIFSFFFFCFGFVLFLF